MASAYEQLLAWVQHKQLSADDLPAALQQTEIWPNAQSWQAFSRYLLLWLGFSFLACGLVFFFAYNWEAMGKFGKFALAALFILSALLAVLWQGLAKLAGQAALFAAGIGLGALLALIGQTYQTGADTFQLFLIWAAMLLPLALLGQNTATWLLWVAVTNVGCALYIATFRANFRAWETLDIFAANPEMWSIFLLNTVLQAAWEIGARYQQFGLQGRLGPRVLAVLGGSAIIGLGLFNSSHWGGADAANFWLATAWLIGFILLYRWLQLDLFMLAGGGFAAILLGLRVIGEPVLHGSGTGGFLFLAIFVIGASMLSVNWLRQLAKENT